MTEQIKPYKESKLGKKAQITQMFDTISGEYDGLNRVISFGIDVKWRKEIVDNLKAAGVKQVIDLATGTGDLAISIAQNTQAEVVGVDISKGMLEVGNKKLNALGLTDKVEMLVADAENLPFNDESFDAATVAFGVRNFEDLQTGLSEILRVLKPGGTLLILETSVPEKFPFRQGYKIYTNFIMPVVGKIFSKDKKAYGYLSESANNFPYGMTFNNILSEIGFKEVRHLPQTFGVATIYEAKK